MPGIEMKLKKIPIKFEHFQLVGIFLMFKEHYKKYAVQVLYPEKSRIGRSKENKFSSNIFGLPLVSNCCDQLALSQHLNISKSNNCGQQTIFLASSCIIKQTTKNRVGR
jgi:hypothetical protein